MIPNGPQIAIIDDRQNEVQDIIDTLERRRVGYKYFNASIGEDEQPDEPIKSIETIFLDLHFQTGLAELDFDPSLPAGWVDHIVPENRNYNLVIWTKDSNKAQQLIDLLYQLNKLPYFWFAAQKNEYQTSDEEYNIEGLLNKISQNFTEHHKAEESVMLGEIVNIEEDHVLINCLLNETPPVFQVRRFDHDLLNGVINLEEDKFVTIKIITEPGKRSFEFFPQREDLSEKFQQEDYFEKFKNTPFSGEQTE